MSIGRTLQRHPRCLERMYVATRVLVLWLAPLMKRVGFETAGLWIRWFEETSKRWIFDCRMCGQCILHSTGMTCPMTCPKNLRNGPCGGVRSDGSCEVAKDMPCIWTQAFERSRLMGKYSNGLTILQPPLDHRLEGTSAWVNLVTHADQQVPPGWRGAGESDRCI